MQKKTAVAEGYALTFYTSHARLFFLHNSFCVAHFSLTMSGHEGERKVTSRKGSFADVPKDLLDKITWLEDLFVVPTDRLKKITDHFVNELAKGLSVEGGSIVCTNPFMRSQVIT